MCSSFDLLAVMGKAEGSVAREEWHGHVTALSVAPEFRRLGLAAKLMEMLEEISERFVTILVLFSKGMTITNCFLSVMFNAALWPLRRVGSDLEEDMCCT